MEPTIAMATVIGAVSFSRYGVARGIALST